MSFAAKRLVDRMGELKAEEARIKVEFEGLREELISLGESPVEGEWFRATVSHSVVNSVNWKAIAEKLNASSRMIKANTSESPRVTVKVVARNGSAVAA